jgi:hypothetical protein
MGLLPTGAPTAALGATPQVDLLGVEVTQAIQNLAHQVPLVRGKRTVVRVYLQPRALTAPLVVQGEVAVSPASGGTARYVPSSGTTTLLPANHPPLPAQRRDVAASLNFILPADLVSLDGIAVRVKRVFGPGGAVQLGGGGDAVTLPLVEAPPLRIRVVGLRYVLTAPDGSQSDVPPDAFHFEYLRSFLSRAYPVAEVEWSQIVVTANALFAPPFAGSVLPDGTDPVWLAKLNLAHNQLAALRAKDVDAGMDPRTHYYGLVSDAGGFFRGAARSVPVAADPTVVAVGPAGDPSRYASLAWDADRSFCDWYGAHELAHTFGRFHPGFCGGQDASDTAFPYPEGRIGDDVHGDMVGFDVGDPTLQLPMRGVPNETCHDLMTYCDHQWISAHTYTAILDRLRVEHETFDPKNA